MNTKNKTYQAPTAELLVVRFEDALLQTSNRVRINGFIEDSGELDAE